MDIVVKLLVIWVLVSIPASLLVGRFFAVINRGRNEQKSIVAQPEPLASQKRSRRFAKTLTIRSQTQDVDPLKS